MRQSQAAAAASVAPAGDPAPAEALLRLEHLAGAVARGVLSWPRAMQVGPWNYCQWKYSHKRLKQCWPIFLACQGRLHSNAGSRAARCDSLVTILQRKGVCEHGPLGFGPTSPSAPTNSVASAESATDGPPVEGTMRSR